MAKVYFSDVVIVGAGLAGERAAIECAAKNLTVNIISLVEPRRSHSNAAQGGVQASLGNMKESEGDDWKTHFEDTVRGSDWGADQDVVEIVCKLAPSLVREMEYFGTPFSRTKGGKIAQRNFGGTAKWRTCYASDGTGHALLYALDSQVGRLKIPVFTRHQAISLIHDGRKCSGVVACDTASGELIVFAAKSVILACGGYGRLYRESTNALINWGDGMNLAFETGIVPLGNMEAVQFHPTGLVQNGILMTEGCRGDGGVLLDKNGYEFMRDYAPKAKNNGNLASRDVVARGMMKRIRGGFGVKSPYGEHLWLDIKRLGKEHIEKKLSDIAFICRNFIGVDPVKDLIPVRPVQHYSMGGVRTDIFGETYGLKGLFAAGETACWDLHGFNRLGGNSLLETIAAGCVVGGRAVDYAKNTDSVFRSSFIEKEVKKQEEKIKVIAGRQRGENGTRILAELQNTLSDKVGIFRNADSLYEALISLKLLSEKAKQVAIQNKNQAANHELEMALRLPGMIKLGMAIVSGALNRRESRGSHFREDYPKRDDENFLKRTLAYSTESGIIIKYEDVVITHLPPGDRGYGEGGVK